MTARDRRAVLLGAAILLGVAAIVRGGPATVRGLAGLRERAAERQAALARSRDLLARSPLIRDSLALAAAAVVKLAPQLIEGRTRAEAAAALAALVSLDAGRSALKVLRLAPSGDSAAGILQPVRVTAELEGDVRGLTQFLATLERRHPLLSAVAFAVTAPEVTPRPNAPEALHLEVEVQGWFLARTDP